MKTQAEIIEEICDKNNITPNDLRKRLNIDAGYFSRIYNGINKIPKHVFKELKEEFNVSHKDTLNYAYYSEMQHILRGNNGINLKVDIENSSVKKKQLLALFSVLFSFRIDTITDKECEKLLKILGKNIEI